jgi:hypothetical protein
VYNHVYFESVKERAKRLSRLLVVSRNRIFLISYGSEPFTVWGAGKTGASSRLVTLAEQLVLLFWREAATETRIVLEAPRFDVRSHLRNRLIKWN